MSLEDDISGLNSSSFLCVHGNASSRCPPLREAERLMREAYRQPHTHTHISPQGGPLQLTCYERRPYGLQRNCMLFLSRRELNIADKKGSVCVVGERKNISERRTFSETTDNVPSAHSRVYERHWTTAVRNYCIVIKWLLPHWQPY